MIEHRAIPVFSLESFHREYETDTAEIVVRGRNFRFFVPKTLERFVDPDDVFSDFPLWSKLWEPSMVLADHLAGMKVEPEKRFLEIGCGLGLVGIVASSFGHRVTMTEYNSRALDFAQANAESNRPSFDPNLDIMQLDWNSPKLEGLFDYIVGSEVIYRESDFQAILKLFEARLRHEGEIILAERVRKTSIEFFRQAGQVFRIRAQKKVLRSVEEEIKVILCRMRFKSVPC